MAENMTEPIDDDTPITVFELARRSTRDNSGRPAGGIIRSSEEMTVCELDLFASLARMERELHHKKRDVEMIMRDWKRFWSKVFDGWNSACRVDEDMPIEPPTFPNTDVLVGVLSRDHPPTEECPSRKKPPERRRGADVFLSATTKATNDTVDFVWKDSQGKIVNPSHVRITVGKYTSAMYLAIERYDNSLTKAYDELNDAHIINYARRVVLFFAKEGGGYGTFYPRWFNPPTLKEPELARPRARTLAKRWAELLDMIEG